MTNLINLTILYISIPLYPMQASDDQQPSFSLNEDSHDQTAFSIHQENQEHDYEWLQLSPYLQTYFQSQLVNDMKLDNLDLQPFMQHHNPCILKPSPQLYFLPHTILLPKSANLTDLRQRIIKLQSKPKSTSYNRERQQLDLIVHSHFELVFYKIRKIQTDRELHRYMDMLDPISLVTRLYQYYQHFYQQLHFRETTGFILYWAHQKQILNDNYLTQSAIKLLMICVFLNFGYGVSNVLLSYSREQEFQMKVKKMNGYCRIDNKGNTQIDDALVDKFVQYTVEEKKGFYMASRKGFMKIKDILPVEFPLLPMEPQQTIKHKGQIQEAIHEVLTNQNQKMSLCKNIYRTFNFLHNKFSKRVKFIIDLQKKHGYKQQFAQNFELQVIHPVLKSNLCKAIEKNSLRRIKGEIDRIHQSFKKHQDPVVTFKSMFCKN